MEPRKRMKGSACPTVLDWVEGGTTAGVLSATARAPTNIAVVKYWGKRCTKHNLPINSSVSVTLSPEDLSTVTTVVAIRGAASDRLWLNGAEELAVGQNKRVVRVLEEIRRRASDVMDAVTGKVAVSRADWPQYRVHIVSRNSFPTAAGLASSASGYACLVRALATLYGVEESYAGELTTIARMGSGSACRSLYGGFVKWEMGAAADGADSLGVQVASEGHWPDLHAVICVVSDHKKGTSSTAGMGTSVRTSLLLAHRAASIVPGRMLEMENAIARRDFACFAELTMRDSNQFHATCLDTFPPIFYMNDVSRSIVALVHALNDEANEIRYAYTFDAGPNAVIFCLGANSEALLNRVLARFSPDQGDFEDDFGFVRGRTVHTAKEVREKFPPDSAGVVGGVRYVYHTRVGEGATVLPTDSADVLAGADGMPIEASS